jgi:hypothetical protein
MAQITLNSSGVASNGSLLLQSNGTTTAVTIDTAQNMGLGVTPSAWGGSFKALQLANGASFSSDASPIAHTSLNAYYDGSNWKYIATNYATNYYQLLGSHVWRNAPSGTAGNTVSFTQAMTLDASGNLGIGTTSPASATRLTLDYPGFVQMLMRSSGTDRISLYGDASVSAVDGKANPLAFYAGSAERARITSAGDLLVGKNVANDGIAGVHIYGGATAGVVSMVYAGRPLYINRLSTDGDLIDFAQAGTTEGSISVSGTTVSYNGGHLSRYAQTQGAKDESLVKGTVLSNLDEMNVYVAPTTYWTEEDELPEGVSVGNVKVETHSVNNEQLNKVKVSDVEGDANVAGVFVNWSHDEAHDVDEINMAMTGDMIIRIAQGTTVQRGDLLMSAGNGTAKPQGDDIVRSKTVAKVTSTHVTCTYADGSYCVPCVLMAC